jgi:arylsulfatase A
MGPLLMNGRLVGALLAGTIEVVAASQVPNVVVILTDDQGWADVGIYGAEGFETPHLDELAAEGMRFTDFYVAAPFCSPSRAALLTGCYPQRVGIRRALQRRSEIGLHPDEVTVADLLRERGYATAVIGKWHLGRPMEPAFAPARHGFDEVFCPPVEPPTAADDGSPSTTVLFTERAVDFIDRRADRPFFLYLAPWMPHVPLEVSERFAGKSELGLHRARDDHRPPADAREARGRSASGPPDRRPRHRAAAPRGARGPVTSRASLLLSRQEPAGGP